MNTLDPKSLWELYADLYMPAEKVAIIEAMNKLKNTLDFEPMEALLQNPENFDRDTSGQVAKYMRILVNNIKHQALLMKYLEEYLWDENESDISDEIKLDIQHIISNATLSTLKKNILINTPKDFLKEMTPKVLSLYLRELPLNFENSNKEWSAFYNFKTTLFEDLSKVYPLVPNKFKHLFENKTKLKIWREEFEISVFSPYIYKILNNILKEENETEVFKNFFRLLELISVDLQSWYLNFIIDKIHALYTEEQDKKARIQLKKQEDQERQNEKNKQKLWDDHSSRPLTYLQNTFSQIGSDFSFDILPIEVSEKLLAINSFHLSPKLKKELTNRLKRLYKNGKTFKKSDYFGENPTFFEITAEDEGKLLDIVEEIGLEIVEETALTPEEIDIQTFQDTRTPETLRPSNNQSNSRIITLDASNELVVNICMERLIQMDYAFENEKMLRKELDTFCQDTINKKTLISFFSDENKLKDLQKKTDTLWTLEVWAARFIIIKHADGSYAVDSFHASHDKYEIRLDHLR